MGDTGPQRRDKPVGGRNDSASANREFKPTKIIVDREGLGKPTSTASLRENALKYLDEHQQQGD